MPTHGGRAIHVDSWRFAECIGTGEYLGAHEYMDLVSCGMAFEEGGSRLTIRAGL